MDCPLTHHRISDSPLIAKKINEIIPDIYLETDHGYGCDEEHILPEVSEVELVRHYVKLSTRNFGVDTGFYPLGSCTMKYNPKINEYTASLPGFLTHPYQSSNQIQGSLELLYDLEQKLCKITGMDAFTLQPSAGAHGEFTGISIMKKYFHEKGETKKFIIVPDSAHGTNPATAAMCQYGVITITSNKHGEVSLEELEAAMQQRDVAGIMLTNPNTLGLFDRNILKITEIVHRYGGLAYYDGANMNAMMGKCKPGEMGFDIIHLNLHKTFSTPHGGGGPGSGPVGVKKFLTEYLPNPRIVYNDKKYTLSEVATKSIGKVKAFYGNFGILVRAYTYILMMGEDGLIRASENAVLNANYLRSLLSTEYKVPFDRICQHEFVMSDETLKNECTTLDLAKRLLDYGFHAPTIYFPLIVSGAIMIEPTETETKETLDTFAQTLKKIKTESIREPELLKKAPISTVVGRLDEVKAARQPKLKFEN
ncbi:MAG: aminomethyl-transferring glycine dehydrogenase subunit GcvPB [Candidatus Lokiarchaeota archaeon]|nr:aminomethyl-transferring glycine dehydrogenase subunit GcvPB [Candidatus Lokiarchaeota archaeon]